MTSQSTAPIHSSNISHLSRMDVGGAGQVTVAGNYAYLGYMRGPEGTSILDISDPRNPKLMSTVMLDGAGYHSHKVRVVGDIMIVNSERYGAKEAEWQDGGFKIYDIKDKSNPKLIHFQKTYGKGVHRFAADERYAYISTEMEGFVGNILVIYDIQNPSKPVEAGRWWMPGQNVAAGETPDPKGKEHRLHHALRQGDQLYAGCWMSGYWIIDISDISRPKTLGKYDPHPEAAEPSHTFVKVPFKVKGKDIALGVDEERSNRGGDEGRPHAPLYIVDVSDATKPEKITAFHVPEDASPYANGGPGTRYGAHQLREVIDDTLCYVTWFGAGLRIIDFADPSAPKDVGHFIPEPGRGYKAPLTNDVAMDDRGLIYVTDKGRGLDVIEFKR
ncbi:MAG: hypothetical protein RLZ98_2622 [Pseudomonadota bacterium]|jgi:hypothetical protein